jgi:hypothetical protein
VTIRANWSPLPEHLPPARTFSAIDCRIRYTELYGCTRPAAVMPGVLGGMLVAA